MSNQDDHQDVEYARIFAPDSRYKIAHREAIFGIVLAILNFIWWFAFAYGLGLKDISQYHYVMGLPAWFFYSCVLGFVVFSLVVIVMVKCFYTDISLDAEDPQTPGGV